MYNRHPIGSFNLCERRITLYMGVVLQSRRKIRQKREDRREMAVFAIGVLHNIFSVRGVG